MTHAGSLAMPWAPDRGLYCAPGRLVLKLVLGETPDSMPTVRDVRTGYHPPATRVDGGGPVDRMLAHFTRGFRVSRVHGAAASRHQFGKRHHNYSAAEFACGLAGTLRVQLEREAPIGQAVDALRQLGVVESATPHYLCVQAAFAAPALAHRSSAQDDGWASRELVRTAEALAYEPGDSALIVAIVDTGVAPKNREFADKLRAGFDTVQLGPMDLATGLHLLGDLRDEDMEPDDEVGHGTACAGIIGARGDDIPPGLGGEARLLPIRVLGSAATPGKDAPIGVGALCDIDDGLKRAIDLGAKVLNLSFGTPIEALDAHDPMPHEDVVRYGLARGCIMIAASGNTGQEERFSPACLDGVIAVGAVDDLGTPADFSTRGDHVAISAPGVRVMSAGLKETARVTGTSFAAPFVTAAAALLVSRANRRATPIGVKDADRLLRESARSFAGGPRAGAGTGILDAAEALRRLDRYIDGHLAPVGNLTGSEG
jgi:subtilisin family serine protease